MFGKQIPSRLLVVILVSACLLTDALLAGAGTTFGIEDWPVGPSPVAHEDFELLEALPSNAQSLSGELADPSRSSGQPASAQARSVTYTYDAAGRLVTVDYGRGNRITYTYDSAGNLLSRAVETGAEVYLPTVLKNYTQ